MKIESTGKNCILARLSEKELSLFELTYDKLDYSDERVRAFLQDILNEACLETGRPLNLSKKLQIEVIPDKNGGCLIRFSDSSEENAEAFFEAESADQLLDLAKACRGSSAFGEKSRLYSLSGRFRLAVRGLTQDERLFVSEFLTALESSPLTAARTEEQWECVIPENALKILGGRRAQG